MEKSLFTNSWDICFYHDDPNHIKSKTKNGEYFVIFPLVSKEGICFESSMENSIGSDLLLKAANAYYECNKRYLCVHLKTSKAQPQLITVQAHGFFSDELLQKHPEWLNLRFRLQIILQLHTSEEEFYCCCGINTEMETSTLQTAKTPKGDGEFQSCIGNELFIERNIELEKNGLSFVVPRSYDDNTLTGYSKIVFFSDIHSRQASICEKIKNRDCHSDLVILASNGTELSCHKHFLAGLSCQTHSDVLATMIHSGLKETSTGKIEMKDLSEEGGKAFLEFIYERRISRPSESCEVAFEIFQAAHKYNIPEMESTMKQILLSKPNEWFQMEVGLSLFLFARELDGCEELKVKAARVINSKSKEHLELTLLEDFFKENHVLAVELFSCL